MAQRSSSPNVVVFFIQEVPPSAMKGEYEREGCGASTVRTKRQFMGEGLMKGSGYPDHQVLLAHLRDL
jgi:hypothetical protein